MESKWLEDFIVLAESGSFSRAAQARHITQPAFSRRIRSLESWLGADLIDRSCFPVQLTAAGTSFHKEAIQMLAHLRKVRGELSDDRRTNDVIEFALPHNLSLTFFPQWMRSVTKALGPIRSRVRADNVVAAVTRLTEGSCDVMMCYHHRLHPIKLDENAYDMIVLGHERVRPYVRSGLLDNDGFPWPGTAKRPVPVLAYSPGAYLSHIAALLIKRCKPQLVIDPVFETDMAESIKVMALEGHGMAFLPDSAVSREVRTGKLVALGSDHEELEVRAYRARDQRRPAASAVAKLWSYLSLGAERSLQQPGSRGNAA